MSTRPRPHRVWPAVRRAVFRIALAGLLCAIAVGLGCVGRQALEQVTAETARAGEAVALKQRSREARRVYAPRYAQLRARGYIGETSRTGVIEAMQESATRLGLRHLTFELQPAVVAANMETSRMTLQVGLLHEGELLRLFDQLSARAPAILQVRRCTLERRDPGNTSWQQETDNLRADCLVEWLTVRAQ